MYNLSNPYPELPSVMYLDLQKHSSNHSSQSQPIYRLHTPPYCLVHYSLGNLLAIKREDLVKYNPVWICSDLFLKAKLSTTQYPRPR
jgi:hypothetical protein